MRPRARLGERLTQAGHLTDEQLEQALERKRASGGFLGDILVDMGFVPPEIVGRTLADMIGVPYVHLPETAIEPEAVAAVSEHTQRAFGVVPYNIEGDTIYIAMVDPLNVLDIDNLQLLTGMRVVAALATRSELDDAHRRIFSATAAAQGVIEEIEATAAPQPDRDISIDQLVGMAEDAPIIRLVNSIIAEGIATGASDIHIEPQEHTVRVRYRIDGMLTERMQFSVHHLPAVVSRIKIVSHLNIAERRRSQDGRIAFTSAGANVELRISTFLLAHGEKVVMRILDKRAIQVPIEQLGFLPQQMHLWQTLLDRPYGIILVTGPTGSGKSTTLYTSLRVLNDEARNIVTVEDPIEYDLPGINQSQVNPRIGVTFAAGLRTIVRQDPDIIMVGEIRDPETAEVAVQAALTGHLVLSTLHTNDASGALVRLQNLGIEPFLIASSVIGIAAQRLVRNVCPNCAEPDATDDRVLRRAGLGALASRSGGLRRGAGCSRCEGRGTRGRTAVYETLGMSDDLRDAVVRRGSGRELHEIAVREGMTTMFEAGVQKALAGKVPAEEIRRVLLTADAVDTPYSEAAEGDPSMLRGA